MTIMRKVWMTVAFFLVLAAQVVSAQNDEKAEKILSEVSAKTKTFKTMSANFVFAMKNKEMDIDEKNAGSIKVKGQKYAVKLPDLGVEVFSDGKTVWNYMKDGNQVTISNVEDEGNELMTPSSIFSIYERGFRSEYVGEANVRGKKVYKINLFPDSDEYDVTKVEVAIDKTSMFLKTATLHSTDGNLYTILVKKMISNQNFSDTDFVFDKSKHDDVEVIDLR